MITAMQSAKLKAVIALLEARDKIVSCIPYICFSPADTKKLREAEERLDHLISKIAPSNVAPKNDGL